MFLVPITHAAMRLMEASDVDALFEVAADDFLRDVFEFVVEDDFVVGVPAYRAGDVEHYVVQEEERGRNLVGDDFGRVEVTGVEGEHDVVLNGVAEAHFEGADGAGLCADSEDFAFD